MAKAKKTAALTVEERLEQALVSEAEQLYQVPENWCWTKLPNLVSIKTGKKDANYSTENGKYLFFTCAAEPLKCDDFSFEGETILVAGNGANVGLCIYYNGKCEVYQRTYVLQKKCNMMLKYIYYHFNCFWKDYNGDKQYGSATNYIKLGNFENYLVCVPPPAEQQRIVDCIESLFAKLDEAKEKAQAALDSFETRKAAILHKAFTGELTAKWREENGVGMDSWKLKTSKELFAYVTSGSRGWAQYYANFGDIFIRMGNLDHDTIELDLSDIQYINLPSKAEGQRSKLQKGDILISITADVGMIALIRDIEFNAYINQHIALARPTGIDSAEFIAWYLVSDVGLKQMQRKQRGATKVGLGLDDIRQLELSIPTIGEQSEIVRILDNFFAKEQKAKELCSVLDNIDLIKKSILARAFRGELGTNDPTEESAVELLKGIC